MFSQLLTGLQFNENFTKKLGENEPLILIKLTNEFECHNGFSFKTGLNIDFIPFNPKGECQPGGIYFCNISFYLIKTNIFVIYK